MEPVTNPFTKPRADRRTGRDDRREVTSAASERRRVATELNDVAMQSLLSARQDLRAAQKGDPTGLVFAWRAVEDAIAHLRTITAEADTGWALKVPLGDALRAVSRAIGRRHGLRVEVAVLDDPAPNPADDLLFRLANEFLANAARHAQASRASISVSRDRDGTRLTVSDDGVGFDGSRPAASGHIGLALARRRVLQADGHLSIVSAAGQGATVQVDLPRVPTLVAA